MVLPPPPSCVTLLSPLPCPPSVAAAPPPPPPAVVPASPRQCVRCLRRCHCPPCPPLLSSARRRHHLSTGHPRRPPAALPLARPKCPGNMLHIPGAAAARRADPLSLKFRVKYLDVKLITRI